jgi:hypothetical protein
MNDGKNHNNVAYMDADNSAGDNCVIATKQGAKRGLVLYSLSWWGPLAYMSR